MVTVVDASRSKHMQHLYKYQDSRDLNEYIVRIRLCAKTREAMDAVSGKKGER